jgi:hypothetical protein
MSPLPFLAIRVLIAGTFIVIRDPVFFMLDKVGICVQLLTLGWLPVWLEIVAVLMELAMGAVWALTKDQRMEHFDSKVGLGKAFSKQCFIYLLLLGEAMLTQWSNNYVNNSATGSNDMVFLLMGMVLLLLAVDSSEFYY